MHASTCTSALVTLPSLHSSASFLIPHHVCAPPSLPRFLHLLLPSSLCPDLPSLVPAGRLHGSGSGGGHGLVAYTGVAVVGDMECTGSSCSPPNPPTAKYPALPLFFQPSHSVAFRVLPSVPPKRPEPPFKLEPLFSPCRFRGGAWGSTPPLLRTPPLVAMQVAVVGAEGGSTPLGWDGMGENRDWVVWNKVEGRGVRVNTDASPRPSLVAVQVPWGWEGGSTATHWNWRQEGEFGDGLGLARYAASLLGSPLSPSPLHSLLQLSSVLSFSYLFLLVLARVFLFMSTHQFLRLLLSCPTSPFSARYQADQHQGKAAHTSSRAAEQEGWEEDCRGRESPGGASPALCSPPALTPSDKWRGGACGSTPTLPHAPPLWPTGGRQHCSTAPVSLLGATRGEYGDGLGLTRPVFQATDPPTPTTGNPSGSSSAPPKPNSPLSRFSFSTAQYTHCCCVCALQVVGRGVGSTPPLLCTPPLVAMQAEGGEHWSKSGVHPLTHLLLSPFSLPSQQHPAWPTEESLPPLTPPSLSTSQQPQHHGALHD
ncbi:unnamed protein product [Closterium sp. NIES-65]|nr:unnamed protein product [Closterium sp. NIES-65]